MVQHGIPLSIFLLPMYIRRHHLLPPYFDNSKTYLVINILFIKEVLSLGFPWPGLSPLPIPPLNPVLVLGLQLY